MRDIGPNCEVPAISAGGAVELPLPSTWTFTFGYILRKASAHSVIMLFMVSEPTLLMLPDTPDVFWYAVNRGIDLDLLGERGGREGHERRHRHETLHETFLQIPLRLKTRRACVNVLCRVR